MQVQKISLLNKLRLTNLDKAIEDSAAQYKTKHDRKGLKMI